MKKTVPVHNHKQRRPLQARAREKVELILEAAIRLLEKGGPAALTTNAVAERAGVSIGSLYQYFANKEAILDALADREVVAMGSRVRDVMADPSISSPEARVAAIVTAVAASYGDRRGAHRIVMEHSLTRGGARTSPLLMELTAHLAQERDIGAVRRPLAETDAFVLTHAFAGVLRAMTTQADAPPKEDIARALAALVNRFVR
ncbi:MAG: helix-turn-helix domain-containing protein [Sphingomonas sp.]